MSTNAKKRYSKVRMEFDAIYPQGYTLTEICALYKVKYPNEPRDVAGYVCGQESWANFIKCGERNGEAIYVSHKPTKKERLEAKMRTCVANAKSNKRTYLQVEARLRRLLKGEYVRTDDLWDLSDDQ